MFNRRGRKERKEILTDYFSDLFLPQARMLELLFGVGVLTKMFGVLT